MVVPGCVASLFIVATALRPLTNKHALIALVQLLAHREGLSDIVHKQILQVFETQVRLQKFLNYRALLGAFDFLNLVLLLVAILRPPLSELLVRIAEVGP